MNFDFDAIVVGAGHAGIEAARALCARGSSTALITFDESKIGAMSCNPAIGGVAKGHLVFEVDALGGWMGAAADLSSIQSRRLNINKGPAVRSTRVQCDKDRYSQTMRKWCLAQKNLRVISGEAAGLEFDSESSAKKVCGVRLKDGSLIRAKAVVITAGTFMRGIMFCGDQRAEGGRIGDSAANFLTESLVRSGHEIVRLKTGTPARLKAESIRFDGLELQWGDPEKRKFSWREPTHKLPQLACYITHTNERTHDAIRSNFHRSALFSGEIVGVGPRYCPSVEDKIKRFPDRERHQIFLEPEGLNTNSIYPNGMSTSLPAEVQLEFLRTIAGLENVEILKAGYAVEYDTINPTQLHPSFMSKMIEGLFLAGQVNRTSGYEEAAAQGLWAGINASLYVGGEEPLRPSRSRSYLETLVDDLTSIGTEEPYRMFTSRSEYRLILREDNAHERLFDLGSELGLLSDEQKRWNDAVRLDVERGLSSLLAARKRVDVSKVISYFEYLKRPEVCWEDFASDLEVDVCDLALEKLEVKAKYEGYLVKQEQELKQLDLVKSWELDPAFDVSSIPALSKEIVEKYKQHKPRSVYELLRISGVTPAAVLSISKLAGRRPSVFGDVSRETSSS